MVGRPEGSKMAWRMTGTYIAACSCNLICPCPTDGPPISDDGQCRGVGVFHIADGNLDDTDISGVSVALVNLFPSNLTAGNWKLGIVVDEGASDEQANAIEQIISGKEGGPFEQFAALTDEWLGMERGSVGFSDGDRPTGSLAGVDFSFEPLAGPEGSDTQTTVKNAAFGFAPEFRVGRSSGHFNVHGIEFDAIYGETADYEFSSEMEEGAATGRG
jgi:hypothetical protein